MNRDERKWVLITGGSRGIGKETALRLAKKGYNIAITFNRGEVESDEILSEIQEKGSLAKKYRVDLSQREAVGNLAKEVARDLGKIFALINNAGIYVGNYLNETTDEEWYRVMEINLNAPFKLSRDLAEMITDGGSVVNVSSVYGIRNDPWGFPYQASKAALIHLTRALAKALGPRLRVNAVAPGFIKTDMNADGWNDPDFRSRIERRTPMKRWGEPADIARAIDFLIDPESSFITGSILVVDGGIGI
ncbi:MAG: SDR family oxidoreductase [Thermoplasmataceae archaeon]